MKLAALGVATLIVGLVVTVPGLVLLGMLWFPSGLLIRRLWGGIDATETTLVLRRGPILLSIASAPALVVGISGWGFDSHPGFRVVPLVVGGVAALLLLAGLSLTATGEAVGLATQNRGMPTVPATVVIRSVSETGAFINDCPRLEFEFEVVTEQGASYAVTKRATAPPHAMSSVRVGGGFLALVDPANPTTMNIDWGTPLPADADVAAELGQLRLLHRRGLISDEEYDRARAAHLRRP